MLATQNGLENVFKEMNQLKQKELKTQEEIKAMKAARHHWTSKYLDKDREVIKLETVEGSLKEQMREADTRDLRKTEEMKKLKETNNSLDSKNKIMTEELTNSR